MTLSVSAVGAERVSYRWRKDEEDIIDPTSFTGIDASSLTINQFLPEHQGKYLCVIKHSEGSIESEPADLALGNYNYNCNADLKYIMLFQLCRF